SEHEPHLGSRDESLYLSLPRLRALRGAWIQFLASAGRAGPGPTRRHGHGGTEVAGRLRQRGIITQSVPDGSSLHSRRAGAAGNPDAMGRLLAGAVSSGVPGDTVYEDVARPVRFLRTRAG